MSKELEQAKIEMDKYNEIYKEIWDEDVTAFDELRFMKFFKAGIELYKPLKLVEGSLLK